MGEQLDNLGEHLIAVLADESKGKLGVEQAVALADVMPRALEFMGEVTFAEEQLRQGTRQTGVASHRRSRKVTAKDFHDRRGQHMQPEKAQVTTRPQSGDDEFLLGLGGGRLFDHGFHLV